jgi:filamentous hemagglutinin
LLNGGTSNQTDTFVNDHGQIYLDSGAAIDVSGSEDVSASVAEDIVAVQLRGPQLANSPVQQNGALRGQTIDVDIRQYGIYNGQAWVGTPLADTSGYVGLVERSVGELTTPGGTVSISAGDSVVLAPGSAINVSGGWIDYQGGQVQTSNVISAGQIYPIADATPNLVYSGIYTGTTMTTDAKWGVTQSVANPMASATYDPGFLQGGSAGSLSIEAPAMVLQGSLYGNTVEGAFQRTSARQVAMTFATDPSVIPTMQSILAVPTAGSLSLSFQGGQIAAEEFTPDSPTPPNIVFKESQSAAAPAPFNASDLLIPGPGGLRGVEIDLPPDLINLDGFGNLSIDVAGGLSGVGIANPGGDITIPAGTNLNAPAGSEITLVGANVTIDGNVSAPGGSLSFLALDASNTSPATSTPTIDPSRGTVTVGPEATLDVAGLTVSDSPLSSTAGSLPLITAGGSIVIKGFNADLASGSTINASGGVWVSSAGAVTFGTGGSITIDGGSDPDIPSLIGGTLGFSPGTVDLMGYAGPGVRGATLTIQAPLIQVGGNLLENGDSPNSADTLWIDQTNSTGSLLKPDFFSQGGFSHFALEGLGEAVVDASGQNIANDFLPAVTIAPGTVNPSTGALVVPSVIRPMAQSWQAIPPSAAGNPTLQVSATLLSSGQRQSVGIAFDAEGVAAQFNENGGFNIVRGDLVMGAGSVIQTDPVPYEGVSLSGNTVTVLGSIIAPGGNISITGSNNSDVLFSSQTQPQALPTVDLGPTSDLDASGTTVITPNGFGFLTGTVLSGGSISVAGNIVAESGSRLNVSGWSDSKDSAGLLYFPRTSVSGAASVAGNPVSALYAPAVVDSNGGTITLAGSQELYTDATLVGAAGGPSAQGGTLVVTSKPYIPSSVVVANPPLNVAVVVTQNGPTLPASFTLSGPAVIGSPVDPGSVDSNGNPIPETGHFAASSLATYAFLNPNGTATVVQGGFDWITLGSSAGALEFSGSVSISAHRSLTIGVNGVITILPTAANPNPTVNLQAPEVEIGSPFPLPSVQWTSSIPGISPLYGPGTLNVTASDLIDVGDLSLQQVGTASFNAGSGSIRGDGTFDMVGVLNLSAAQIYPTTAGRFTVVGYDYPGGQGTTEPGTITISSSDNGQLPQVPLSAGGQLDIYASDIVQGGVLRAPIGTINLGWNGDDGGTPDAAHTDQNTGEPVPTTQNLTLLAKSVTSVSAADPTITELPYGSNENGTAWIDPTGTDITVSGVPGKTITLAGAQIVDQPGSSINLSGGGDLYAYEWISGNGGTNDVLSPNYTPNPSSPSLVSFAVVSGYQPNYSPYAPYAINTTGLGSDPGYVANVNGSIKVGDQVYLGAGDSLPAGFYTVLPARYALLPGGYLITPISGATAASSAAQTDGSSVVSGYRFNDLSPLPQGAQPLLTSFDVALGTALSPAASTPASVVRAESQYADFYASTFLSQSAQANGAAVPQLPPDGGQLVLTATNTLTLQGMVEAQAASGGNGGLVDISSPSGISIGQAAQSGNLVLNPTELDNFGAASLLIGGVRGTTADGVQVTVTTPLDHGRQRRIALDRFRHNSGGEQFNHPGGGGGHRAIGHAGGFGRDTSFRRSEHERTDRGLGQWRRSASLQRCFGRDFAGGRRPIHHAIACHRPECARPRRQRHLGFNCGDHIGSIGKPGWGGFHRQLG